MENQIKDLEILSKYLTEEELKEVAKEVARDAFASTIGKHNPHAEANLKYYVGQGAFQAVEEYMADFDKEELAKDMKDKTKSLIKSLHNYQLPDVYKKIAEKEVENNRDIIEGKVKELISNFVNSDSYESAYSTFEQCVGERFADLLWNNLKKEFKKD